MFDDWFGGSAGVENTQLSDGFNWGSYDFGRTDYVSVPPPEGTVSYQARANNEFSWFDPSRLQGTFEDVLNAGIGAAKVALDQEIRGGTSRSSGMGFFDVLRNASLDRFSSSKTGREMRSQVLASQVRTFLSNPLYLIATLAVVVVGFMLVMRR